MAEQSPSKPPDLVPGPKHLMPKFLETKLRAEYGNNPRAIYGTMNAIGAMRGNKETAKGREMQKKHDRKVKLVSVSHLRA